MYDFFESGARGTRTPDLLGAIQALSQLSYSPEDPPTVSRFRAGDARIRSASPSRVGVAAGRRRVAGRAREHAGRALFPVARSGGKRVLRGEARPAGRVSAG